MNVSIRRAAAEDADFLLGLVTDDAVRPFLGPRTPSDREALVAEIERSQREPGDFGRFVIEADGERAGTIGFHVAHEPSRIARLERLAVHPAFRGREVADRAARLVQRLLVHELGFHRLELEIYAFNEHALTHAERVGFVREGVKRKAYRKDGRWVDTVLYSLLAEDIAAEDIEPPG